MEPFNHKNGRYFPVMDANIYVEETGSSDGFPLILLHGGCGTINDFSPFISQITGNFRCIGIETRGHGKSTLGNHPLSYALLESDLESIVKQLGISQCMMMGFSDGGVVAYRFAIKNPSLIFKLITVGADWNLPNPRLQKLYTNLSSSAWQKKFPETVELYEKLNPEANFNRLLENLISMWVDMSTSGYPDSQLKEIQCETLIIRGDDDHLMPRSSITQLHEYLPNAKLLNIAFAGHAAHIDQREIVSRIVNKFLQS